MQSDVKLGSANYQNDKMCMGSVSLITLVGFLTSFK